MPAARQPKQRAADAAPAAPPGHAYLGLDLVRFAAAMLVVACHLSYWSWLEPAGDPRSAAFAATLAPLAPITSAGWIGVQIFFVLSGFVIAFSGDGKDAGAFLRGRALRLYPAVWVCATITAAACLLVDRPGVLPVYLFSMVLSPLGPHIDGVYWTLGVEILFYASVAAVLAWSGSRRLAALGTALAAASAAFWSARFLDLACGGRFASAFAWFDTPAGALTLLPHGAFFALGIIAWSAVHEGATRGKGLIAAACVLTGMVQILFEAARRAAEAGMEASASSFATPSLIWLAGLAAMAAAIRGNRGAWRRLGRWSGPIRAAGLATFPLYLLHNMVGTQIMRLFLGGNAWAALLAAAAAVTAASFAICLFVEPRVRGALEKAMTGGKGGGAALPVREARSPA